MGKVYFLMGETPKPAQKKKSKAEREREKRRLERQKNNLAEILGAGIEIGGQRAGTWPQVSMSMGVHPVQVRRANEKLRAAGTTAYHLPDGRLVLPDAGQRKKVIKMQSHRVDLESFS